MNFHHFRVRTTQERVIDGLPGKKPWPKLVIERTPGKGRSVFLSCGVNKDDFLLEYQFDCTYPREERAAREQKYAENDKPCMVLEVQTRGGWVCLDATRCTYWGSGTPHEPCPTINCHCQAPQGTPPQWQVAGGACRHT